VFFELFFLFFHFSICVKMVRMAFDSKGLNLSLILVVLSYMSTFVTKNGFCEFLVPSYNIIQVKI
jgi:hypothetical protein